MKMMGAKRLMIFAVASFSLYSPCLQARSGRDCQLLLSHKSDKPTSTGNFIAYTERLLNERIIPVQELAYWVEKLKEGVIVNPISRDLAMTNVGAPIHREGLQKQIDLEGNLEISELRDWGVGELARRNIIHTEREIISEDVQELPGNNNKNFWEEWWWEKANKRDLKYINVRRHKNVIHYAVKYAPPETLKMFLEIRRQDISLDARDQDGWTALMNAVMNRYKEKVKLLIDAGADVNAMEKGARLTALKIARDMKQKEIADLLKKAGAKE